jgi:RHS repeat-associated protein
VSYAYDAFNRLVKRSAGFNTTYFDYDEGINPHLQMDTQSGNQITHRYLWSDQVDELFADEQRLSGLVPDTKWALSDHQLTIKDIADFNPTTGQTSVRHRAYDSFGNRKGSALPTDIVFGYTGKYFDETTGLQNSWNRWYSPKMGRFISQDPIGFAGGDANLYRYVEKTLGDTPLCSLQQRHSRQKSRFDCSLGPLSRADGFSTEFLTAGTMVPAYFDFCRICQQRQSRQK